jgi:hypothetical protein
MTIEVTGGLVLLIAAIVTIRFVVGTRRRRVCAALALAGAVDIVCGLIALGLATAHLTAILGLAVMRALGAAVGPAYTLRFYSLLLLGMAVAVPGFLCAASAQRLTERRAGAWRQACWATLWLLAVNVPLIPLNGFGTFLSVFALANLISLGAVRRRVGTTLWRQAA